MLTLTKNKMFEINICSFTLETLEELLKLLNQKLRKGSIVMDVSDFNIFQILYE